MPSRNRPETVLTGFGMGDLLLVAILVSIGGIGLVMAFREGLRRRATP